MKEQVVFFILLFALLSACRTPVATEPAVQAQFTRTITTTTPIFTSQPQLSLGTPFCQGEPEYVQLGSSTNITVFGLPPSQPIAVYLDSVLMATGSTNLDGHASMNVTIPANETIGLHQVSVYAIGTPTIVTCQIKFWSDLIPSSTYRPPPTSTPKPTLSPSQLTLTATLQTLQERLGKHCRPSSALRASLSPNGQWVEVNCELDVLKIVSSDESKIWDMSSSKLVDPYTDHSVYVSRWSNDSAYVYVRANPHTDGYWEFFHQGFVLYRLTLETGQISEVLPLVKSNWRFYSFAFSPNDRRLAYIITDHSPAALNIRDMQTGIEQSFEFDPKYNTGGGFLWSPDSRRLVFSITQFDTSIYEDIGTSVILWDKDKSDATTLIRDHEEILVPVEWIDETRILLQVLYKDEIRFEFDMISGVLKQISP